jgi:coenzyme F420-reducing hydrogenase gamma subunit
MACGQGIVFEDNPDMCIGPTACNAACVLDTPCDGLNGIDPVESSRFNECTFDCFQMK